MELLIKKLDNQQFKGLVGEIGNHIDHRSNLALDLAVFDRSKLTGKKITAKYIDVVPAILGVFLN